MRILIAPPSVGMSWPSARARWIACFNVILFEFLIHSWIAHGWSLVTFRKRLTCNMAFPSKMIWSIIFPSLPSLSQKQARTALHAICFITVLSLIFSEYILTAFGQEWLVSYSAVPYSLSLIKYTACRMAASIGIRYQHQPEAEAG